MINESHHAALDSAEIEYLYERKIDELKVLIRDMIEILDGNCGVPEDTIKMLINRAKELI